MKKKTKAGHLKRCMECMKPKSSRKTKTIRKGNVISFVSSRILALIRRRTGSGEQYCTGSSTKGFVQGCRRGTFTAAGLPDKVAQGQHQERKRRRELPGERRMGEGLCV